jgi:hypothetical protein
VLAYMRAKLEQPSPEDSRADDDQIDVSDLPPM